MHRAVIGFICCSKRRAVRVITSSDGHKHGQPALLRRWAAINLSLIVSDFSKPLKVSSTLIMFGMQVQIRLFSKARDYFPGIGVKMFNHLPDKVRVLKAVKFRRVSWRSSWGVLLSILCLEVLRLILSTAIIVMSCPVNIFFKKTKSTTESIRQWPVGDKE